MGRRKMKRKRADGGPAFPRRSDTKPNGDLAWPQDGMTLRDFYVGCALTGLCANPNMEYTINFGSIALRIAKQTIKEKNK